MTNPVTAATRNDLGDLVLLLMNRGAKLNVFGGGNGATPLINAVCTLGPDLIDEMVRRGALVNTVDRNQDTALTVSASFGKIKNVHVLLHHKAKVNFCDKHNGTALHAAASNGHANIVRLLLQYGANPTIRGGPYDTVIQAAAASGNEDCMVALLVEKNSWSDKLDVNAQGGEKFTPLHAASANINDGCLQILLERKPKLNVLPRANPHVGTPLYAAAFAGCNRNARLLLEAGADPSIGAGKNGSVLQAAVLKCGIELCDLLISNGAKI